MKQTLLSLEKRREYLISESAAQRLVLAQNIDTWRKPLARVDKAVVALRYVKNHPILIAGGGSLLLLVMQPGRIGKWVRLVWVTWWIFRKFRCKSSS